MRELSPLLITSPSVRSGTTLLQRLLCSASNALVYGEEIGKDLELQLQIFTSRQLIYRHSRQRFTSQLDRVVRGEGDGWILDLMPDVDAYLEALQGGAFAGLANCAQHAKHLGRPIWGFKYPGWPPHLMRQLFDVLPATRVICIVRDLGDTARSAKAWGAIHDQHPLPAFCAQWLQHLAFLRQWQQNHDVLMLAYDTLVDAPDHAIAQLCDFLPLADMDRSVLERRINSAGQDGQGNRVRSGYVAPAALTPYEQACVDDTLAAAQAGIRPALP